MSCHMLLSRPAFVLLSAVKTSALQAEVATVLRHGRLSLLPAAELVPGDIVEVSGVHGVLSACRFILVCEEKRVKNDYLIHQYAFKLS